MRQLTGGVTQLMRASGRDSSHAFHVLEIENLMVYPLSRADARRHESASYVPMTCHRCKGDLRIRCHRLGRGDEEV
jgi:hypothetical protein